MSVNQTVPSNVSIGSSSKPGITALSWFSFAGNHVNLLCNVKTKLVSLSAKS